MKKNNMMRIAGILFIAVLLTTGISGTFAKYVTSGSIEDHARVAKFGVTIVGSGSLFDGNYYNKDQGNGPAGNAEDTDNVVLTVESSNTDKLVAPGAKNDTGLSMTVTGAPEVDVKVTLAIDESSKDIWLVQNGALPDRTTAALKDTFDNEEVYTPIVYTLKLNGEELQKGNLDTIKTYLNGYVKNVDANTNMTATPLVYTLTWEWDFDDDGAGTYDKQDTLLGDIAAYRSGITCTLPGEDLTLVQGDHYNVDVDVKLSVRVTQVD